MSSHAARLRERLERGETLLVRAHGIAGGGLVLLTQALGAALASHRNLDVEAWPIFPPSRRGGLVTAYLRVAAGRVEPCAAASSAPDIVVLLNEAAAAELDFAEGTDAALYVLNTPRSPEEAAARWRLGGTVATVAGDALARKHLGRPLANGAVLAALVSSVGLEPQAARTALRDRLRRRGLPERMVEANLALFADSLGHIRSAEVPAVGTAHLARPFRGFGVLPAGGQFGLRTSSRRGARRENAGRVDFADPRNQCDGCALCVALCPEGVLELSVDTGRPGILRGARFEGFCQVCGECVAACPFGLFTRVDEISPVRGEP